jgi:hypothetical protein
MPESLTCSGGEAAKSPSGQGSEPRFSILGLAIRTSLGARLLCELPNSEGLWQVWVIAEHRTTKHCGKRRENCDVPRTS